LKRLTIIFVFFLTAVTAFGQDEGLAPPDQGSEGSAGQVNNLTPDPPAPQRVADPVRNEPPIQVPDPVRTDKAPVKSDNEPQPDSAPGWKSREEVEREVDRCQQQRQLEEGRSRYYEGVARRKDITEADRAWARAKVRRATANANKLAVSIAVLQREIQRIRTQVSANTRQIVELDRRSQEQGNRLSSLEKRQDSDSSKFTKHGEQTDSRLTNLEKGRETNRQGFNWLTVAVCILAFFLFLALLRR